MRGPVLPPVASRARSRVLWAAGLALLVCGAFELAFARYGLNLRDEGYLWFGVVSLPTLGKFPLRAPMRGVPLSGLPEREYPCSCCLTNPASTEPGKGQGAK